MTSSALTPNGQKWVSSTINQLTHMGYRLIPHYPNGNNTPYPFKDGQLYDINDPVWTSSPMISIALNDLVLLDYDGNKSSDIITVDDLASSIVLRKDTLMSSCVQSNTEGNSLHFLFRRGCPLDQLSMSRDGWKPHIDIKTGNQLMHLKPGKELNIPPLDELKVAPQALIEALRKAPSHMKAANDDFHFNNWLENIEDGVAFHDSTLRLSAYLINKGVQQHLVTDLLQMALLSKEKEQVTPNQVSRFNDRLNDIPRLVQGAVDKDFNKQLFNKVGFLGTNWLAHDVPAPRILINDLMPSNVFGFVGAGGAAKTTLLLKLMVHIVLGIPVWGRSINYVGKCLFVSAEDDLTTIQYRLQRIVKAMSLSDDQRKTVEESIFIHDISGDMIRFVEADNNGNLSITRHVDDLIDIYQNQGLEFVCFDPAVFFGPGERYVNDAEAALMQCARRISQALGGITTGYIHHMSKMAALEKDTSMHAGRGGSAFGDNARCLWVLHKYDPKNNKDKKIPPPNQIDSASLSDGRVALLTVAKFSMGAHEPGPFWMVRHAQDGFSIDLIESPHHTPEDLANKLNKKEQSLKEIRIETLLKIIKEGYYSGKRHGLSSIKSTSISTPNAGVIPKNQISALIDEMVRLGKIEKIKDDNDGRKILLEPSLKKDPSTSLGNLI